MIEKTLFSSIGDEEVDLATQAMAYPLSGYLAGQDCGGTWVCNLEDEWARKFGVKHAIATNSATSGLLAAAFAVGLQSGDHFVCPAMTMSATAAAPMFTGATPHFVDVEDETFGIVCGAMPETTKAIFSTNLFGHPSPLGRNEWAKDWGTYLVEDNAQSPFAMAHGRYCGTMGHIGVFSLNVHKPLQCGEGGIIVTDDDRLAARLRAFINHGEHAVETIGLNLRMPELCAAVALVQLQRGESIIAGRIAQAEAIIAAIGTIPGLRMPVVRPGCRHVYYTIPFTFEMRIGIADGNANIFHIGAERRAKFCEALREQGVPIVEGYAGGPLYRMPAFAPFARPCPVAEDLHDRRLFYFENCAWDVVPEQIGDAFRLAAKVAL